MEQAVQRDDIKPIRVTKHAQQRMDEFKMSYKALVWNLLHSVPEKEGGKGKWKEEKYGGNEGIKYYRSGTYIFTVKNKKDDRTGKEITLVITLCDQRIDLEEVPPGEGKWTH